MFFSIALVAAALNVQQVNCFPKDDPMSNDRAVLSFVLPENPRELPAVGTLFLSSGIGEYGEEENSGVMPLARLEDADSSSDLVQFAAQNQGSRFVVSIAEKDLGKASRDFTLTIDLERIADRYRVTQEVRCYANIYEQ
jgi:hypothetical protein